MTDNPEPSEGHKNAHYSVSKQNKHTTYAQNSTEKQKLYAGNNYFTQ